MQLSMIGEYALRAMLYICSKPFGTSYQISEIAEKNDIPDNFLRKIIPLLKKSNLVKLIAFAGNQRNHLAWLGAPMDTIKKEPRFNKSSDENDNFTQTHLQLHYQHVFKNSQ